jgi:hypothetical protein
MRLIRVPVELKLGADPQKQRVEAGRMFLHEFRPNAALLFVPHYIARGEPVSLTIETPQRISAKGEVAWCADPITISKLLSGDGRFAYRLMLRLQADEKQAEQLQTLTQALRLKAG